MAHHNIVDVKQVNVYLPNVKLLNIGGRLPLNLKAGFAFNDAEIWSDDDYSYRNSTAQSMPDEKQNEGPIPDDNAAPNLTDAWFW